MDLDNAIKLLEKDPAYLGAVARIAGYTSVPPTIDQFVEDPYYLGNVLAADEKPGAGIYPYWREALRKIYPTQFTSPYLECVASGAIGQGKSTFCSIGMMYDCCKLLHLKSPQAYYGLLPSTKIVFALINATLELSGGVLWDQIQLWITESPFFRAQVAKGGRARHKDGTLFPHQIDIQVGSRQTHTLGKAIVSAILSEINFQSLYFHQAYTNYNSVRTRLQSRFMTKLGYPGRVWIDSSKNESGSFVEDYVIKDRGDDPELVVFDNPIWKVLWHKGIYSGNFFKVFQGDDTKDPILLETDDQRLEWLDLDKVIDVPVEYYQNFKSDLPGALKDIAGVSTYAGFKFISSVEKIEEALCRDNPVTKKIISLDLYDQSERLIDYLDWSKFAETKKNKARFIHVDLGLTSNRAGVASTYIDEIILVERRDPTTLKTVQIRQPIYVTDFVLCIEAKPGQEVPIYKIKQLVMDLRHRGYHIEEVSTDGYQSAEMRQDLTVDGFKTKLISVDKTADPYVTLKRSILESRWRGVKHEILADELKGLITIGGKVDHTKTGSKDLSDACAGSVYNAFMNLGLVYREENTVQVLSVLDQLKQKKTDYEMIAQYAKSPGVDYFQYGRY